jgi:LysM repeat protein
MPTRPVHSLAVPLALAALAALAVPMPAAADFVHTVSAGESLSSVAAADGLSVDQLAAANGLSPDAQLISGTALSIPPQSAPVTGTATSVAPTESTSTSGGYVVQPGDTLSAIAAREGVSVGSLAAANGLDPNGILVSGSTLSLSGAPAAATSSPATGGYVVQPGDTLSAIAARAGTSVGSLAAANGLDPNGILLSGSTLSLSGQAAVATSSSTAAGYLVQPGDTLSAIAAREGTTVTALAAANGLDPNGILLSGSTLSLSGSAPVSSSSTSAGAAGQPVGTAALTSSTGAPYPTPEVVSASQVGTIASANGVPPSLAEAIGWQESGFNNNLTSSTGAHGVMQIEPGTWDWIQNSLAGNSLSPSSAADNVRGGVLMLRSLLQSTGGNEAQAAAGYYQGLSSVQQNGMYTDTQSYVNSVMALASRFGGG